MNFLLKKIHKPHIATCILTALSIFFGQQFTLAADVPIYYGDTTRAVSQQTFILNADDETGNSKLQFGSTLNSSLTWDSTNSYFTFSDNVNFNNKELINARVENTGSATCDVASSGRLYFDTDDSLSYICDGSTWKQIDASGSGGTSHTLLSATHTDTVSQTVSRGSLVYGNSTPKWDELAIGNAGQYLRSDGTDLSWSWAKVRTVSSSPATVAADDEIVRIDASSNNMTVNLPTAVGRAGKMYLLVRVDSPSGAGANTVTIFPNGSEEINGLAAVDLDYEFDWIRIRSDGSNWLRMGQNAHEWVWVVAADETTFAWTNKASALQEILNTNRYRTQVDLSTYRQFRIVFSVATTGSASSVTGLQYSDDGGSTWYGLDNGTSGSLSTETISDASSGLKVSNWVNITDQARTDVQLRIAGEGGNGTADPAYGTMKVQFR